MKRYIQKTYWLPILLTFLLLLPQNAFGGAPAGHTESLEPALLKLLKEELDHEFREPPFIMMHYLRSDVMKAEEKGCAPDIGYLIDDLENQIVDIAIPAYLWKKRHKLTSKRAEVSGARQVDLTFCLLKKGGSSKFDKYVDPIEDWCNSMIK